ncbi:MAG: chemotaxis protein CheW [Desulfobacterales bacterium]
MKEIMLFQAGKVQFGLDLSWVKGVYRAADLSELPGRDEPAREGVRSCRLPDGAEMPLYDFPILFGMPSTALPGFSPYRKVIRLEAESASLVLLADHIDRVVEASGEQIAALPPVFGEKARKWFPYIFQSDMQLIPLLDPRGMAGAVPFPAQSGAEEIFSGLIRAQSVEKQILTAIHREMRRGMRRELFKMAKKLISAVRH